ncbi:hypothetical protein EX290_12360 [Enterococcus faecium]|nr:hypothetical protein [Enterococcus faecium]MBO1093407.1 hypothetical protein [Enterococcus lactis]RAX29900.1 hypothetical protein DQE80_12315 [Enterococcus sp. HPCN18]HAW88909.1 hypothetical protein [Enterococcus sp.]EGP5191911.1 hypothetical protein [Enterococcus faecium]
MSLNRGCGKDVLHQVISPAKQKQRFMFLNWLDLLPQVQAFEHRYSEEGTVTRFLLQSLCI